MTTPTDTELLRLCDEAEHPVRALVPWLLVEPLFHAARESVALRGEVAKLRKEAAEVDECLRQGLVGQRNTHLRRADLAEAQNVALLEENAMLRARASEWLAAMPRCAHVRDLETNARSCPRRATKGPQDPTENVFGDVWCDEHAPTDRDTEDCDWLEDLPWGDLVRTAAAAADWIGKAESAAPQRVWDIAVHQGDIKIGSVELLFDSWGCKVFVVRPRFPGGFGVSAFYAHGACYAAILGAGLRGEETTVSLTGTSGGWQSFLHSAADGVIWTLVRWRGTRKVWNADPAEVLAATEPKS